MFDQQYDSRQNQLDNGSDTFECPSCHADILKSNQVIHEAVCARQRRQNGNERQIRPEPLARQGSSSEISSVPDTMRQPQVRREDRRIAENKLITCPNCEKGIREQNFANHMENECEANDKIPCEFCDQPIPMKFYTQHIDDCPRRAQEQQNNRPASPIRRPESSQRQEQERRPEPRPEPRQNERPQESNNNRNQQQGAQQPRSRSAESSEQQPGGFMDFLHNIASAAYNSLTNTNTDQRGNEQQQQQQQQQQQRQQQQVREQQQRQQQERERQQRQQQERERQQQQQSGGGALSLLSRLLGVHGDESHEQDPRGRNQPNARQRATTPPSQHFDPFGLFTQQSQPSAPPLRRQNSGLALVRTIERGPNGTVSVRMRMVPADQARQMQQMGGQRQVRPMDMEEMGPMGILLSMLSNQNPGSMGGMNFGDMGGMNQEVSTGLDPEIMGSLATVKYDKEKNKNVDPEAKSCPICLEEFENGDNLRYLWCMHRFHMKCVDNWLKDHTNCPICKKEFSEEEHNYEG